MEQYERKQAGEGQDCVVNVEIPIHDVDSETATNLRKELRNHGLSDGGVADVLMLRWKDHLRQFHPEEHAKDRTCSVTKELENLIE